MEAVHAINNTLYFFLPDGQILRDMKMVGLDLEAVELFHNTISKQLSMDDGRSVFTNSIEDVFC